MSRRARNVLIIGFLLVAAACASARTPSAERPTTRSANVVQVLRVDSSVYNSLTRLLDSVRADTAVWARLERARNDTAMLATLERVLADTAVWARLDRMRNDPDVIARLQRLNAQADSILSRLQPPPSQPRRP